MTSFKPEQLLSVLQVYHQKLFTGILQVDVTVVEGQAQRSRLIVFTQGLITYVGLNFPKKQELVKRIGRQLQNKNISSAINLAEKKNKDGSSLLDYLTLFVQLELFNWKDFEEFMQSTIVWTLEQIVPYQGTLKVSFQDEKVLDYMKELPGFSVPQLTSTLKARQQQWSALAPYIPSIEAVPQQHTAPEDNSAALKHLQKCVNGQRSLLQIAYALEKDPLKLAQTYCSWTQKGWITCGGETQASSPPSVPQQERPVILSVDDSTVVQAMIKRSISDRYHVLLASNAVDALNMLNREPISLILLDVTMPDIDGLELCRTIRNISKFRTLPIIMLSAKDGMFDKIKGQMAGSTHYLNKPVDRDKLLQMIDKYISTGHSLRSFTLQAS
ncbi:MAG: PleD family two-component system response regulator [Thermosynechococcaceae cyanobacterium]